MTEEADVGISDLLGVLLMVVFGLELLAWVHSFQKTSLHIGLYSKILHSAINPHQVMPTAIIIILLFYLLQLPPHRLYPTKKLLTLIPLLKLPKLLHQLSLVTLKRHNIRHHASNFMRTMLQVNNLLRRVTELMQLVLLTKVSLLLSGVEGWV
jgi:hypothetical protein